jgi:hypothetical protein
MKKYPRGTEKELNKINYGVVEQSLGKFRMRLSALRDLLADDKKLRGIRFNELAGDIECKNVPWKRRDNPFWTKLDTIYLKCYLSERYDYDLYHPFTDSELEQAIWIVADSRTITFKEEKNEK